MAKVKFLLNSAWTAESVLPEGYTLGINAFADISVALSKAVAGDNLTIENVGSTYTLATFDASKLASLTLNGDYDGTAVAGGNIIFDKNGSFNGTAFSVGIPAADEPATTAADGSLTVKGAVFAAASGITPGTDKAVVNLVITGDVAADTALLSAKPQTGKDITVNISVADGVALGDSYLLNTIYALTIANGAVNANYDAIDYVLSDALIAAGYSVLKTCSGIYLTTAQYDMSSIVANTAWAGKNTGDIVTYNGMNYVFGINAFATSAEAFATAKINTDKEIVTNVILADSEYILSTPSNTAFNTAYYGNFTINSDKKVTIYAYGWDGYAYGSNDGTVGIGNDLTKLTFGENIELYAEGRTRFGGTIDVYGTVLSYYKTKNYYDAFIYNSNNNYCVNIYSTGTFGLGKGAYLSGSIGGNINVIGNDSDFRSSGQWIVAKDAYASDKYANWLSLKVEAKTTDKNAGTVTITDYGFAEIYNSFGFGTKAASYEDGTAGMSQLIMDTGKLYVDKQLYFGYNSGSATNFGYATADIKGDSYIYANEFSLSNLGVWSQSYSSTFKYGTSFNLEDGADFSIDFTGLSGASETTTYTIIDGSAATGTTSNFDQITYTINGKKKTADEVRKATGYSIVNDGKSVYAVQNIFVSDIVVSEKWASGYSYGDTITVNGVDYNYEINAFSDIDAAYDVAIISGTALGKQITLSVIADGKGPHVIRATDFTDIVVNDAWAGKYSLDDSVTVGCVDYSFGINAFDSLDAACGALSFAQANNVISTVTNTSATASVVTDLSAGDGLVLKGSFTVIGLTGDLTIGNGSTVTASGSVNGTITVVGGGSFTAANGMTVADGGSVSYSIILDANTDASKGILTVNNSILIEDKTSINYDNYVAYELTINVSSAEGFTASGMYKLSDPLTVTSAGQVFVDYSKMNYTLSGDLIDAGYGIVKTVNGVFMTTEEYDMTTIVANDQWATGYNIGDTIKYAGKTYTFGYNAFAKIEDALATAKFNYDPEKIVDVIAASDYTLTTLGAKALNFGNIGNIRISGAVGGTTTIDASGVWAYNYFANRTSTVCGENGGQYIIGENLNIINRDTRFATQGVIDIYGTFSDVGLDPFFRSYNEADYQINVYSTGTWSIRSIAGKLGGNINIIGDGKAFRETAQLDFKHAYAGLILIQDVWAPVKENAATLCVKDYGYAVIGNSVGVGSADDFQEAQVIVDNGKLVLNAVSGGTGDEGNLLIGYTSETAVGSGSVIVTGDDAELIATGIDVSTSGKMVIDYTSTITYRDGYYTDTEFAAGSFSIAVGDSATGTKDGDVSIDFTGMNSETGDIFYSIVNGLDATGVNENFDKIYYTMNGEKKTAAEIMKATGYSIVNDGKNVYAVQSTTTSLQMAVSDSWASGYEFGDKITVNGVDYYYGVSAFSDVNTAFMTAGLTSKNVGEQVTLTVVDAATGKDNEFIHFGVDGYDVKLAGYSTTGKDVTLTVPSYGQDATQNYNTHIGNLVVDSSLTTFASKFNFGVGGTMDVYTAITAGEVLPLDGLDTAAGKTATINIYEDGHFIDGSYINMMAWADATVTINSIGNGTAFGDEQMYVWSPWTCSAVATWNFAARDYGVGTFKIGGVDVSERPVTVTLGVKNAASISLDNGKMNLTGNGTFSFGTKMTTTLTGNSVLSVTNLELQEGASISSVYTSTISYSGSLTGAGTIKIAVDGLSSESQSMYTIISGGDESGEAITNYSFTKDGKAISSADIKTQTGYEVLTKGNIIYLQKKQVENVFSPLTSLKNSIDALAANGTLTLAGNYQYDATEDSAFTGITIDKNKSVVGNGFSIDAGTKSRLFNVSGKTTVFNLESSVLKNALSSGGGGAVSSSGIFTATSNTFSGNSASYGGAVNIATYSSTFTANDNLFSGNVASNGGAVYNSGTFTAIGSTFSGNTAKYGGAVYCYCTFIATGSTFSGNTAKNGGAVNNCYLDRVTAIGSTFSKNMASQNGGAVHNNGTFTALGNMFSQNTAAFGGAVYNDYASTFTASSNTFLNNFATNGGAVYNESKRGDVYGHLANVADSVFNGNTAKNNGGAIYNLGTPTLFTIKNDTFIKNKAAANGGALYNEGILTMSSSTFTGNSAAVGGAIYNLGTISFSGNIVLGSDSDTIYNAGVFDWNLMDWHRGENGRINRFDLIENKKDLAITVSSFDITGNTYVLAENAANAANATFILHEGLEEATSISVGQEITYRQKKYRLSLNDNDELVFSVVQGVEVLYSSRIVVRQGETKDLGTVIPGGSYWNVAAISENGSAILNAGTLSGTYQQGKPLTISGNAASANGGALYNTGTASFGNVNFTYNVADLSGGAVYNSGILSFLNGSFLGNTASKGGAVFNSGTLSATGSTFSKNTGGPGAAVYNTGTFTATSNTFSGNTVPPLSNSSAAGGAVNNFRVVIAVGNTFSGNSAEDGGAVRNSSGSTLTATNNTFNGNQASAGGAVYNSGTSTATGNIFSGNMAIYSAGAVSNSGTFTANSNTFSGNTASYNGGAVYNGYGIFTAINNTFIGNMASTAGGAVRNDRGTFTATSNIFSGNTAKNYGGAVCNGDDCLLIATGNTFSGNMAGTYGGAIYQVGTASSMILRDNYFLTETDTIYIAAGKVTFGGTISLAGNLYSASAITVEANTSLIFDLRNYSAANTKEIITNLDTILGTSSNLSYTVEVSEKQAEGKYLLATGATARTISVKTETGTSIGTMSVGTSKTSGSRTYTYTLEGGSLYFTIAGQATPVTKSLTSLKSSVDALSTNGTLTLTGNYQYDATEDSAFTGIAIDKNKSVVGNGFSIDAGTKSKFFNVSGTSTVFNLESAVLKNAFSSNPGGAIYNIYGTFSLTNDTFSGNVAKYHGGAIYNNLGSLTVTGSTFSGNSAATYGGAVINSGANAQMTANSNTFNENVSDMGGAINNNGIATAKYNIFNGNTVSGSGGAISNDMHGVFIAVGNTFSGNTAKYTGGAIKNTGTFTATDNVFSENVGGAIANISAWQGTVGFYGTFTAIGNTFSRNTASYGAAIKNHYTFDAKNNIFSGNTASPYGGAVYNDAGIFTATGNTFSGNMAGTYGGAIYQVGTASSMILRNNYFLTETDTIYIKAGAVTFGGTISLAGNLYSASAITVEANTSLIFDLRTYSAANTKEIITNLDTILGASSNLSYTVEVSEKQAEGKYLLATGATARTISVKTETGTSIGTMSVGTSKTSGSRTYTYTLEGGSLYFTVAAQATPATQSLTSLKNSVDTLAANGILVLAGNYQYDATEDSAFTGITIDKNKSVIGNGASIDAGTKSRLFSVSGTSTVFNLESAVLKNALSSDKGGAVNNFGTFTATGSTFSGNSASSGGAIYNFDEKANFTAIRNTFSGNTASYGGGAVNITTYSTFTANGNTFSGNFASNGGAVYSYYVGTISAMSNTFTGNTAKNSGGAVYNYGYFTATSNTFSENMASEGGAVYNCVYDHVTVTGNTFSRNIASQNGGAVYNKGTFTALENMFSQNTATSGGAVYNDSMGSFTASSSTFLNNFATNGGAIYSNAGSRKYSYSANIADSVFTGNTAKSSGGAIYNFGSLAHCTIKTDTFIKNKAATNGGALYNEGVLTMSSSTFTGNSAAVGGAIYNLGTISFSGNIVLGSDSDTIYNAGVFDWNLMDWHRGENGRINRFDLIENKKDLAITVSSFDTTGNTYVLAENAANAANATFILHERLEEATLISVGQEITYRQKKYRLSLNDNNELVFSVVQGVEALYSGRIVVNRGETKDLGTVIPGGSYWNVAAISENGSAILNAGTLSGIYQQGKPLTISGNAASANGGALYNTGTASFGNVHFTYNTADLSGGAVYNSGILSFLNGSFLGNIASKGGAVFNSGTLSATGSTFSKNTGGPGAAVYNTGTFTAMSNTFSGNTVPQTGYTSDAGGAVKNDRVLIAVGNTFSENAASYGGAVYNVYAATFTATGNIFSGNMASSYGGAVYNSNVGTFTATGNIFSENTASYGGAVSNNSGTFTATSNTFSENAASYGGAVCNWFGRTLTATNNTFSGNVASYGGAVYNHSATFTATSNTFSGNMAGTYGGAIYQVGTASSMILRDNYFLTETDTIYIAAGDATFGGTISLAGNLYSASAITIEANTSLIFDLRTYSAANTKEIITNLDTILGTSSNLSYTVEVSENQAEGKYLLATGASNFNKTITLKNSMGTTLGTLSVGNSVVAGGKTYSLSKSGGNLSFTVAEGSVATDSIAPVISSVSLAQGTANYTFTATVSATDNKTAVANLKYQVKYATSTSGLNTATAQSGKSFTLTSAAAGKTYYYQVGVTDEAGNTVWSTAAGFTVKDATAPTLNGTPTVTTNGLNATISWSAASDNIGVKGYYLTVDGNTYTTTGTSYSLSNLSVGNHTYSLSAYDAAGNESTKSASQSFTIKELADTVKPTISSVSIAQGAANYTFTASVTATDDKTATANLKYQIRYAQSISGLSTATAFSGKSFTLDSSDAGKTYYYQVGVTDEAGNTAWSNAATCIVNDVTGPTLSDVLTAEYANHTIAFNWNAATDNVSVAGYRLTVNGVDYDVKGTSYTLTDVKSGNYTYSLKAYDGSRNFSASSASKTLTIGALPDLTISTLKVLRNGSPVTTVSLEDKITIYVTVQNIGETDAAASTAKIYCGEVELKTIAVSRIAKGGTAVFSCTVEAGNMSTGVQELRAVVDSEHTLSESDESNNEKTFNLNVENQDLCDLVIGSIRLDKSVYAPGETAKLTFTVKNIGYATAGATKAYVYDGDTYLGSVNVESLAKDVISHELSYSISTDSLSTGTHLIRVVADGVGTAFETSRDNNAATVQLSKIDGCDLQVSKVSVPTGNYDTNSDVTVNFTVMNSNSMSAGASKAGIYDGDKLLGTVDIPSLSGGLSHSASFVIKAGNLSSGSHEIRVVANNDGKIQEANRDNNSRSLSLNIKKHDSTAPTIMENTITQGSSDYSFTVTVKGTDDTTDASQIAWQMKYATSSSALSSATASEKLSFTLTEKDAGKTYYYQVSATDQAGNVRWSDVKSFTVKDVTAPAIGNVSVTTASTSATLKWSATDNVAVTTYKVYFDGTLKSTQTSTSYTISGISVGNHTYRIEAYDKAGNKATTGDVKLDFNDTVAPTITSVSVSQGTADYVFNVSATATDNATESQNIKFRMQYAFSEADLQKAGTSALSFTLKPADAGKTLYYRVSATDGSGNTTWSDVKSVTVKDVTAPDVPLDLTNTVDGTGVTMKWATGVDNVGVTGYYVRYGTSKNLTGQGTKVSANSHQLSSMSSGTYYWQVAAIDASGNISGWSSVSSFKIFPADKYEDNDTAAKAYSLGTLNGQREYTGAAIASATDEDWFKFTLDSRGTENDSITISFNNSDGDLDLYIYSENGSNLIKSSNSMSSSGETISLRGLSKGTYAVKVVGKNGAMNTYTLSTKKVAGYDPDKYDANNPNDTRETATVFDVEKTPKETISELNIHDASDTDFYQITLSNMGIADDYVSISFKNSVGDLDLYLFDASGKQVAKSAGTSNSELISLSGISAGTYYVQVKSEYKKPNEYTLNWNITSNKVEADAYEGKEPIAISETTEINGLTISAEGTGVTQQDTFTISLANVGTSSSKIRFSNYRSDWEGLSYTVKSGSKTVLSGTGAEISLEGLAKGDYTLTVDTPIQGCFGSYDISVSLPEAEEPTWTIFVYMAADNNLEYNALLDVLEMQRANLDSNVDVYVLLDRSPENTTAFGDWTDTRVGKLNYSTGYNITIDWEYLPQGQELNTGNANTLKYFLDWGFDQAPDSDNYAVIMWDHGGGMLSAMTDSTSGSAMDIYQISDVLAGYQQNISVIGFDACLMATSEVVSCFDNITDYLVASEETEGGLGWNWTKVLNAVNGSMNAAEFASAIVTANQNNSSIKTLSAVTTDGKLTEALQNFARTSVDFNENDWLALAFACVKCTDYYAVANFPVFVDLGSVLNSTYISQSSGLSKLFTDALDELKTTYYDSVLNTYSISEYAGSTGLSIYSPCCLVDPSGLNSILQTTQLGSDADYMLFIDTLYSIADQYCFGTTKSSTNSFASKELVVSVDSNTEKIKVEDIGIFSGNGVSFSSLNSVGYNIDTTYLLALTQDSTTKDAIRFTLNNDNVVLTVSLYDTSNQLIRTSTSSGLTAELSLNDLCGNEDYLIKVSSNKFTEYKMSFDADWTTGVDRYDYVQAQVNEKNQNGNGTLEKATILTNGVHSGLLTYSGDADWYQIGSIFSEEYLITVTGSGLTVAEYDASGNFVQNAELSADGEYTMTMKSMNYLFVEGNADISKDEVNSYSISITALKELGSASEIDTESPSTPQDLTQIVTNADVSFDWSDSIDNVAVTSYMFRYGTTQELSGEGTSVLASESALSGLSKGTYYWQVRAFDAAGNMSDWSEVKSFTVSRETPIANDNWEDRKQNGYDGNVGSFDNFGEGASFSDEVGSDDIVDYRVFELDSAGKLSFTIDSINAVKFGIYQLKEDISKPSTYNDLKTLQTTDIKAGQSVTTKGLLLEAGKYVIGISAKNKKDANAAYTVTVDDSSVFFTKGDNSDDWTDLKTTGASGLSATVGTITAAGKILEGWVGFGDAIDYRSFTLDSAATLTFDLNATDSAKFKIYQLTSKTDKKGVTTYSLKTLQTTEIKAGIEKSSKNLLLDKGTYYISMESTNAKKGGSADYTVEVGDSSSFFTKGGNTDDWTDLKTVGASGLSDTVGTITAAGKILTDWVGFGDAIDYRSFTLDSAANLTFDLNATDSAKFKVCQLVAKTDKKGNTTYSLKTLQTTEIKAGIEKSSKNLLLEKGTYYLSMESTNAKKGGSADYTIEVGDSSAFFTKGDNTDDWTDLKTAGANGEVFDLGTVNESGNLITDWVGYGDAIDYSAFTLETATKLSFDLSSTDSAQFKVYQLTSKTDKKGVTTYSLKTLQTTEVKGGVDKTTKDLYLTGGTYYMSMKSTKASKGGSADYTVGISENTVFFPLGDNTNDTWKDAKVLDAVDLGETVDGWVGYGDKADYIKFELDSAGKISLTFDDDTENALSKKQVKITCLNASGKSVSLQTFDGDSIDSKGLLSAGTYYIGVTCADPKKQDVSYELTISKLA